MEAESTAVPAERHWVARHPLLTIGVLLAVALVPFLNQAIQTDDTLFVRTAQWIRHHPLDFFGGTINWWGTEIPMWMANYNPPVLPYLLGGVGSVFGWSEIVLHLAGLGLAFAAAAGIYFLARRWCAQPLLATVIAILTPAFLILSTTLMCDVAMLACWTWAIVLWEGAVADPRSRWEYLAAGVLAGLAVLTKYSAITLLPLLPLLCWGRKENIGWKLAGLGVPVMMIAGFEWLTSRMYGHGLFELASHYARANRFGFAGGWQAKAIIGLAFAGGSLLPLGFLTPWLWRRKAWLIGGAVACGIILAAVVSPYNPGLMHAWVDDGLLMKLGDFRLQVALLTLAGVHLFWLAGTEIWRRRDRITLLLIWWMGTVFLFATVLNWTVNARSFLPAVPAVAILAVRRLSATGNAGSRWLLAPGVAAAVVVAGLAMANEKLADGPRTAAETILAKPASAGPTLWFSGHGGFQYYMEQGGARPLDVARSLIAPGEVVVTPMLGDFVVLPAGSVSPINDLTWRANSGWNLQGRSARSAAGFYTSDNGPVPFAWGVPQPAEYFVVQAAARIQYDSKPDNPEAISAGTLPSFPNPTFTVEDKTPAEDPGAAAQVAEAKQALMAGDEAGAIQHYETALARQGTNTAALSQLAWVLATTSRPELRDTRRAVQLANQAVKISGERQANMLVIFAVAYAADGQLPKALFTLQIARNLAILTGQPDVVASCGRLAQEIAGR